MNSQKFILGSIVGGIVYFFLGFLCYGLLLKDFFTNNAGSATGVMRGDGEMVWWALILGNLFLGCLLAYVFVKAGITSAGSGAASGLVIGLLFGLAMRLIMYGTSNLMTLKSVAAGIVVSAVISSIAGAVVGLVLGMSKKTAAIT